MQCRVSVSGDILKIFCRVFPILVDNSKKRAFLEADVSVYTKNVTFKFFTLSSLDN